MTATIFPPLPWCAWSENLPDQSHRTLQVNPCKTNAVSHPSHELKNKSQLRLRDSCSPPIPHLRLWANTLPMAVSTLRGTELWAICLKDTTLPLTYHTLQDLGALSIWVWQGRNQEKLTFLICFSIYVRLLPWWLRWLKKKAACNEGDWSLIPWLGSDTTEQLTPIWGWNRNYELTLWKIIWKFL